MLAMVTRAAPVRWPAMTAAATYMGIMLGMTWLLQLFPAEPRLAPIYHRVDHMVPLAFPLVLVAPAAALDWIERRLPARNDWIVALIMGLGFVTAMLLVHWPFAEFMLSPAARNFVFAADRWPYMYPVTEWRYEFWRVDRNADGTMDVLNLASSLVFAVGIGAASARLGLALGNFTRRVMR